MEDLGSIPGLGRYAGEGKGYPLQYSVLENFMSCIVRGFPKSRTWLSDFHFGESQGWRSLVGCHLWVCTESDMTETTQQQQHVISLENVLSLTSQSWKITCCMTNQRGRKANRSCSGLERGKNGRWLLIGNGIFFCGGDSALGLGSLGMTVHNWEWAKCHWIVHFKMVKIVDFMCYFTTILKDMT